MAEEAPRVFPKYVTDGHHVYIWNDEYLPLLDQGKIRECPPPPPPPPPPQRPKYTLEQIDEMRAQLLEEAEKQKVIDAQVERMRAKALADADAAVKAPLPPVVEQPKVLED